ncbi:hypothetical protein [Rhodoferax ferrireducens]|uniref:hypothetical protein n=1 Tax=Rhodoferax ferrireducens TaxID=192843 RepID=UPI00140F6DA1|nr:hypothetical protein [Rhodoferax ferrireducens]
MPFVMQIFNVVVWLLCIATIPGGIWLAWKGTSKYPVPTSIVALGLIVAFSSPFAHDTPSGNEGFFWYLVVLPALASWFVGCVVQAFKYVVMRSIARAAINKIHNP